MADNLATFVQQAVVAGNAAHEVEREVWKQVLAMGRQATGHFLQMQGDGNVRGWVQRSETHRDTKSAFRCRCTHGLACRSRPSPTHAVHELRVEQLRVILPLCQLL